jgi:ArsR family transcriptional regulator
MTKQLQQLEHLFKALADGTRLRILGLLLTGEVCVCHIHESLDVPQPKASRHLAYLRRVGLVTTRREGLWVHYRVAALPEPVLEAIAGAVRHALTHVSDVHRDLVRLRKKTGCCMPANVSPAPCCADAPESLPFKGATLAAPAVERRTRRQVSRLA